MYASESPSAAILAAPVPARSISHTSRPTIRHATSSGLIFDANERVLLVAHRALGVWLPPGGHAFAGEDPIECVYREICEEVGIAFDIISGGGIPLDGHPNVRLLPQPLALMEIAVSDNTIGRHTHVDSLYLGRAYSTTLRLQEEELTDAGWFHEHELADLVAVPELSALMHSGLAVLRADQANYACRQGKSRTPRR